MSSVPGTRNPIDARCAPRERASAIAAIAAAFLVALAVFLAAFLARREGGGSGIGERGSLANAGIGDGNGSGVGPGRGTGAADTGAASGSGHEGPGRGARGATEPLPPPGAEPESVASADAAPAAEAAPTIEPPEFGFTAPDRPEPEPMPVPIVVVGVPDGLESAGGAGGPGGDGLRIAEVVENFPDSRCGINLDVTSSMATSRDALATVIPELFERIRTGTITVRSFGDVELGEANRVILPPTRRTKDTRQLRAMIEKVLAVPLEGGGDTPETGYQLVIESMRRTPHGTADRPNVEFIITDAPEKHAHRQAELLELAKRTHTRVFVIMTSFHPPMRIELTRPGSTGVGGTP